MPDNFPKISIVTATFNQGNYIEESIRSILDQEYPNLELIIMDGGSTDDTVNIIKKYERHITFWTSEKDKGLYDALHRGFEKTSGTIMGWLNSDDLLLRKSLFVLADIFSNNQEIEWVQGHPCVADEAGRIIFQRQPRSSKYDFYSKQYHDGIFIQQESTYWRRSLWQKSGQEISTKYKYAGDFELWMRFFKYADLFTTPALIGAFRMRKGQISQEHYQAYLKECDQIIDSYLPGLSRMDQKYLHELNHTGNQSVLNRILRKAGLKTVVSPDSIKHEVTFNHELQIFRKNEGN